MKRNKNERGQSLVELAISILVLALLLSGAVEFGIAFFQFIQLRDAAQEGALYGALYPTETNNIKERVWGSASAPIKDPKNNISVDITPDIAAVGCNIGDGITVKATYVHKVFMPFATLWMGPERPISASATDTILNCP